MGEGARGHRPLPPLPTPYFLFLYQAYLCVRPTSLLGGGLRKAGGTGVSPVLRK